MKAKRKHILSTGVLDDILIEQISAAHEIDVVTFISIEPMVNEELKQEIKELSKSVAYVVFTSSNAVTSVAAMLGEVPVDLKVFSVEGITSKAVAEYFGDDSLKGTAYAGQELADEILKHEEVRDVIFFCGDQRRDELPERLRSKGLQVKEVVVYKTVATPVLLEHRYDAVLFFSPSAVQSFWAKNTLPEETVCFAIGNTTANTIKNIVHNKVVIAHPPQKERVVEMVLEYYR